MEAIIYITIFIIGTLFGSFITLATYRIPLGQDITHKRSYCPNCNHRLEFLDMIPIFSYIFLGGKCRYCKQKIKIRYLLFEIFSGITFLLFALSLKLNIFNFNKNLIAYLVFGLLYISTLFLIAGIENQNHTISKSVLLFGFIVNTIYITYLYIFNFDIYKYVIYLVIFLIILLIETIVLRKTGKQNYTLSILMLCFYMVLATNEEVVILSIILTLLMIAITQIIISSKDNKSEIIAKEQKQIPIGTYLCISNIIFLILQNFTIGVNI